MVWLPFGEHPITARADGHVERAETCTSTRRPDRRCGSCSSAHRWSPAVDEDTSVHPPSRRPAHRHHRDRRRRRRRAVALLLARSAATDAGEARLSETEYDARVERARFRQRLASGLGGAAVVGAAVSGWLWYRTTRPTAVTTSPQRPTAPRPRSADVSDAYTLQG